MTSARHDVARTRVWVDDGTAALVGALDQVADADLDAPTQLSGWSRRHVVAHLARNAEALSRLLAWARTGIITPMYIDSRQRSDEIERSASLDPTRLRRELTATATGLRDDAEALSASQWSARVRSARGREVPAAEVPWMRAREVWLHALDLDIGVDVADLPADFSRTLVEDVVGFFAAMPDGPAVRIASDGDTWTAGDGGPLVHGDPRHLAAWLTGRSAGEGLASDGLPELPPWL